MIKKGKPCTGREPRTGRCRDQIRCSCLRRQGKLWRRVLLDLV